MTSSSVIGRDEISVAGDALENQKINLVSAATAELQKASKAKSRTSARTSADASRGEVEKMRHELSQSLAQGSLSQDLYTTSRSGASEIS